MELKNYRSHARWADNVFTNINGDHISTDDHYSEDEARVVCKRLREEGFGGDGKDFPIETWVTPIPFEEQFPEEAKIFAEICEQRAEAKEKGKRLTPMFLDSENPFNQPITTDKKIGRNDPCPCGSGKKYKKCCA